MIITLAVLAVTAGAGAAGTGQDTDLNVIPWPSHVAQCAGRFTLTGETKINADAAFSAEALSLAANLSLKTGDNGSAIQIRKADTLPSEGYTLEVSTTGATLTAATAAGAFYGGQTLQQLVKDRAIPCVSIQDAPRTAWRGFMLDVSRHFFDKAEVEAVLDQMAALKLNVFHWHLTDDHGWRIEIKKYPKLTSVGAWHPVTGKENKSKHIVDAAPPPRPFAPGIEAARGEGAASTNVTVPMYGGFYTQDEIREIVAYAAARHIRVVPEIDMPGHMSAAAASYPELSPANGWTPVVARQERGSGERCAALCVARPQTVQFCKDVLEEVIALFPSKEIHVGGDEVFYEQWAPCADMKAYKQKLGVKHWEDVQIAFGNEIAAFLAGKGRTAIFWNNIYRQTVDKRAINHFWRNMGNARDFANGGYDVLMSPYVYYFDHAFSLESAYKYDALNIGVKPEAQHRLRGIEGCAWTERVAYVPELENHIYPRLIAIAETGWTPQEQKNWDSFRKRLAHSSAVPARFREQAEKALRATVEARKKP